MVFECTSDLSTTDGSESFNWSGDTEASSPYNWKATNLATPQEGGGIGPSIPVLNGNSLLSNLEFETFTVTDTPDSWDLDSGDVTTHIFKEATAADIHRGTAALKFTGDGAKDPIKISQTPSANTFTPLKQYCVAAWIRGHDAVTTTLTIQFEGTGYTATSTEKISLDAAALQLASRRDVYELEHFFINMPKEIPSDFELVIKTTGALASGKNIRIDGVAVGPVEFHNGIGAAIVAGRTKFLKRDRYTANIVNNNAGVFQTFFRRAYQVQLPSSTSATIPDALASD